MLKKLVKYFVAIAIALFLTPAVFAETEPTEKELDQEVARVTVLLQHDGDNAKYLNDLGFAYYRLHRIPEAMTIFTKAVTLDPGSSITRNNLGAAYMRLKEYGKAEEEFSKALAIDPNFIKAAYNLSVSLYRQNKYLAAYKAYQKAKKIDAAYVKKRFNDSHAREELHAELKKDPDNKTLQTMVKGADGEK